MSPLTDSVNFDGFTVIFLDGDALEDNKEFALVEDDCADFIAKCQKLEVQCLFVRTRLFSQDDFILEVDDALDDGDIDNNEDQNVAAHDESINEFKQYWGAVSAISVTAVIQGERVTKILRENWFQDFEDKKDAVIQRRNDERQRIMDEINKESEKEEIEYEKMKESLIAEMWKLINNHDFCKLPTQKAKLEFAIENIQSLNEIDSDDLKKEIQQINARIIARGLDKRHKRQ